MKSNYEHGMSWARLGAIKEATDYLTLAIKDLNSGVETKISHSMVIYAMCLLKLNVGDFKGFCTYVERANEKGYLNPTHHAILNNIAPLVSGKELHEVDIISICQYLETLQIGAFLISLGANPDQWYTQKQCEDFPEKMFLLRTFVLWNLDPLIIPN
jgi:hypothetical protein